MYATDCHIAVRLLQKPASMAYDFTGLGVAFGQSFMPWGDRNPRDREMATVRGSRSMVNKM